MIGYDNPCIHEDCSSVSLLDLPAGSEPDTFTVSFGDTETISWPVFETELSLHCNSSFDCSSHILYFVQVYDCRSCDDPSACDNTLLGETCDEFNNYLTPQGQSETSYTTVAVTDVNDMAP